MNRKALQAKKEEEERNRPDKVLQLKVIRPGDAVNFPREGDSISM